MSNLLAGLSQSIQGLIRGLLEPGNNDDPGHVGRMDVVRIVRESALQAARYQLTQQDATPEQIAVIDDMLSTLATMDAAEWNTRWYSPAQLEAIREAARDNQ